MAKKRVTLIVEEELDHQVEIIAAIEGKPKHQVVNEALTNLVASKDFLPEYTHPPIQTLKAKTKTA